MRTFILLMILLAITLPLYPQGLRHEVFASPAGNDANLGTKEKPVQSFHKALALVENGGVVTLAGGVYREKADLNLQRTGTAESPLIIQGTPGETAVIKGSMEVTGWVQADNGAWKVEWPVNSQQLFVDGKPLQQIGNASPCCAIMNAPGGKSILPPVGQGLADLKPGAFWYDAAGKMLYCMLPDNANPIEHLMEASVAERLLNGWGRSYVILRNLTFMHSNQTMNGWMNGMVNLGDSHWIVEDCHIEYGDFTGLAGGGNDHIIRHCVISNNGCAGITMNGSDQAHGWKYRPDREPMNIVIEDCTLNNNNYRHFDPNWQAGGMKIIPCCRNVTVRRCTVNDNYGPGIWFDGDLGGHVVEDNVLSGNRQGIFYEISAPAPDDAFGIRIRNNRVYNTVHQAIYIASSEGAIVENNTCWNNWADIVLHGMPRFDLGKQCREWGNTVRNNILYGGGQFGQMIIYTGENSGENVIDGNYYVLSPKNTVTIGVSKDQRYDPKTGELKALLQGTGFEEHAVVGDGPCLDPAKGDFRVKAGVAVGKGWREKVN